MKAYPLKLEGVRKNAIWGGTSLTGAWGVTHTDTHLAELWTLSDRVGDESSVVAGEASGMTPSEALAACGTPVVGEFPLLCKLIDAGDNLSVQVHPDDADLEVTGTPCGKTEMWYVLEAEAGACIYLGTKRGVTREQLLTAMENGDRVEALLEAIPVRPGDVCWIPAGTVHALGKGVLVAEVQQNSDVTYRLYDYGRVGKDGKPRELHTKQAAKVLRLTSREEREAKRFTKKVPIGQEGYTSLVSCDFFFAGELTVDGEQALTVPQDRFLSLLCIDGEGEILFDGASYTVKKGDSYLLPGSMGCCLLRGRMRCLIAG